MDIDTGLSGANGVNSEQARPSAQPAEQSSATATRKVTVKLSDQLFQRLETATDRPGVGKSMVVEAALERFLDARPSIEGLVDEALARITSQLERLHGDVQIIAETVALHARYHLTVTPAMPLAQQRDACADGQERFVALAEQVDRRIRSGTSLMRQTIEQVKARRPAASSIENASSGSARGDHDQLPPGLPDAAAKLTAGIEKDGGNANFRHLPNAFC